MGFALETENGIENAMKKLRAKHLDMIVLNNPTTEGAGFGSVSNAVTVITASGGQDQLPLMPKIDIAHLLLSRVLPLLR
jgi:phosphopantothenoylcysteine decarboxylase/phosphopantothenate--cysteine ligase